MKILIFEGRSDDIFACSGPDIDIDCDVEGTGEPVYMKVEAGDGALIVNARYKQGPCGGWMIGISPVGDERNIPEWAISLRRSDRVDSPALVIDAPDDVKVFLAADASRSRYHDFSDS